MSIEDFQKRRDEKSLNSVHLTHPAATLPHLQERPAQGMDNRAGGRKEPWSFVSLRWQPYPRGGGRTQQKGVPTHKRPIEICEGAGILYIAWRKKRVPKEIQRKFEQFLI